MTHITENYDVIVVGAGHAGCEAALASARLGMETIVFTVSIDSIAMMPCNPNIGGSSKGHLVRELDALGGEMGKNIDHTFIQSKMLNVSKGPAVHSLRAQADKQAYSRQMRKTMENTDHLTIRQTEVSEILTDHDTDNDNDYDNDSDNEIRHSREPGSEITHIRGVRTVSGSEYYAACVILATGVYLNSRCIYGEVSQNTGPNGLQSAVHLTKSLINHGISVRRFKTGTPARVDRRSIDFSKMEEQFGDEVVVPFSFTTDPAAVQIKQDSCWLTHTNEETHRIIRENLDRSPLFSGEIEGTGPRYCPSIEDKVVKFPDRDHHQIFVEPEGRDTSEMYLAGMSSSLPEDVQYAMLRTVPGLENVRIVRNAYAIEYDCIDATQLYPTLEFKNISGLFGAGQINGSSGYEEAAVQGLMAGINAARKAADKDMIVLNRSQAYIGVLIDDLVTKQTQEPYRMMTSRAEYRLLLRQDNADLRLTPVGHEVGLIDDERYKALMQKKKDIETEIKRLENTVVGASENVQLFLKKNGSAALKTAVTMAELIRRPELDYDKLEEIDTARPVLTKAVTEQVNISVKYQGYIERQEQQVRQFQKLEKRKLDPDFPYDQIQGLRIEARQKLMKYRPVSIGQASRISGVSPADISVLLVALEQRQRKNKDDINQEHKNDIEQKDIENKISTE